MKTIAVVTAVAALLLAPVTLYATFRSAPALERIVYVALPAAGACAHAAPAWTVGDVR